VCDAPFSIVILLAGRTAIPKDIPEAAAVWLLMGFFKSIPRELEDAAIYALTFSSIVSLLVLPWER